MKISLEPPRERIRRINDGFAQQRAIMVHYLQERQRPVRFTRSRPYHKDDNGHVEQKNWTHVRQLLGY
ncbi:MAG: Integrase core domain, partial [Pedosphaera sp.]|nr:Integrase core domain [Pedosphaera sp.]